GEFAGTPYYVSPEQAMAKRVPVDHRTDVFSLGVVLYELLTLERPFPGDSSHEVLARIVTKEPADPCRRNAQITAPLAAIVLKALERDPDQRYQSAAALRDDLRAFLAFRPITVRRPAWSTRVRRFCRREPLKAALAALVLVGVPLVTGLASYAFARQDEI